MSASFESIFGNHSWRVIEIAYEELQDSGVELRDESDMLVELYQRMLPDDVAKRRVEEMIKLLKMAVVRVRIEDDFLKNTNPNDFMLIVMEKAKKERLRELEGLYRVLTRHLKE